MCFSIDPCCWNRNCDCVISALQHSCVSCGLISLISHSYWQHCITVVPQTESCKVALNHDISFFPTQQHKHHNSLPPAGRPDSEAVTLWSKTATKHLQQEFILARKPRIDSQGLQRGRDTFSTRPGQSLSPAQRSPIGSCSHLLGISIPMRDYFHKHDTAQNNLTCDTNVEIRNQTGKTEKPAER